MSPRQANKVAALAAASQVTGEKCYSNDQHTTEKTGMKTCAAAGAVPRAATTATIRAVIKAHRITESPALAAGKRRSEATRSPPPS